MIDYTIDLDGKATNSYAADADQFADPNVPKCIAAAVERWKFPKPRGAKVEASQIYELVPGS